MFRFTLSLLLTSALACGGDDNTGYGDPTRPAGDPAPADAHTGDAAVGDPAAGDTVVPEIDWGTLQHPASHTGAAASSVDIFGRVFETGVTDGVGQGAGIVAELALGTSATPLADWSTRPAQFNVDVDNNDEYVATLTLPATPGTYRYAYRFQVDGGPWLWADLDGSDNGFDMVEAGTLVVEAGPPPAVDYCELSAPASLRVGPGVSSGPITGRVYEPGITDSGDPAGIIGQIGVGAEGTDPTTWTWSDAGFQSHVANDDEYVGAIAAPSSAAVYDYGFRFRLATGADWVVCDLDGSSNGFSSDQAGKLTVAVPQVDWARVVAPGVSASVIPGQAVAGVARVYEAGVTEGAGDGGIVAELGVGDDGTDPASHGSWQFYPAAYAGDLDGEGGSTNADDRFVGQVLAPSSAGTHDLAVRVRLGTEPWLYADAGGSNSTDDLYDAAAAQTIGVVDLPANGSISWCNIQWLEGASAPTDNVVVAAGERVGTAYGRVRAVADPGPSETTGATGSGPTPRAQVGVGDRDTDPASHGSWLWSAGTFFVHDGDFNDEHTVVLMAPATAGDYDWAWRFSMDDGVSWSLCDADGSANGYSSAQAGKLTVP